jgi:hypothetical protein
MTSRRWRPELDKEKRRATLSGDQHKTSCMRGLPFNLSGGLDYDLEALEAGAGQRKAKGFV